MSFSHLIIFPITLIFAYSISSTILPAYNQIAWICLVQNVSYENVFYSLVPLIRQNLGHEEQVALGTLDIIG